jgi:hypothetical protein
MGQKYCCYFWCHSNDKARLDNLSPNVPCCIGNWFFKNCVQPSFLTHGAFRGFLLEGNCNALLFPSFIVFPSSPIDRYHYWHYASLYLLPFGCSLGSHLRKLCDSVLSFKPQYFFLPHGLNPFLWRKNDTLECGLHEETWHKGISRGEFSGVTVWLPGNTWGWENGGVCGSWNGT